MRVVSLLDAAVVTGPAKNLMQFCLRARGAADISIATIRRNAGGADDAFLEAARAAGIAVDVMRERFRYDMSVVKQLREIVARHRPRIIETHGVRMHFVVRMSGLHQTIPWVAFHHGYTAEDWKMRAYNQLDRWSLRGAACVFTDCGPFADQLAGMGVPRGRIQVLGSSIESGPAAGEDEVRALKERLGIADGEVTIVSVGRLSREKAQADLIAAAAWLAGTGLKKKFRVLLVGDGPERGRLEDAVAAAGLSGLVVFEGQRRDVRPYYGAADLFVLPSLSEGSPNVLLEAMAAGVPIVSTAVGGVPEMLTHEVSALLVPAGNPAALAAQMERLMAAPELGLRLAARAGEDVRERYSPQVYCDTVLQAYRNQSVSDQ